MSERGSFVTSFFFCGDCLRAVEAVLRETEVAEALTVIHSIYAEKKPIILAGKAYGLAPGEELRSFESLRAELEPVLCHPLTIAVLPNSAEPRFFDYEAKKA